MKSWPTKNSTIYQVLSGRSNAYLIHTRNGNILFDTGKRNAEKRLKEHIRQLPIPTQQVDLLLLSHTHFDHCQNAHSLQNEYNCPVLIDKSEQEYVKNGFTPISKGTNSYFRFLSWAANRLCLPSMQYRPFNTVNLSTANALLAPFKTQLQLLPTRGHSDGSLCLIIDNEIALIGDTVLGYFGKAIYPPFAEHPGHLMQAWKMLIDANCRVYLPGHGREIPRQRLVQSYLRCM